MNVNFRMFVILITNLSLKMSLKYYCQTDNIVNNYMLNINCNVII